MLGLSGTLSYAVFVYLCINIFVFVCLLHGNIIFDILEQFPFQKYTTCWVCLVLCHVLYLCICVFVYLYLCICVFVFVYLCMRHLVISVLISLDHVLSEKIWFVWSKPSYSVDKGRCYQGGTTNQPTKQRKIVLLSKPESRNFEFLAILYYIYI